MEESMKRCAANYPPLSPIRFIERAAIVYGDSTSLVYNSTRFTWRPTRAEQYIILTLLTLKVSVVAPNVPAIYEMHFAVQWQGRFSITSTRVWMLELWLFNSITVLPVVTKALHGTNHKPTVVLIPELVNGTEIIPTSATRGTTYEGLLQDGDPEFETRWPVDEWESIVLSYTSGTDNLLIWGLRSQPVYLWTLPMFHSNGWCFTWGTAALGGTNICLRKFDGHIIYKALNDHQVTHLCAAPVVLSMIANVDPSDRKRLPHRLEILTAGSPPPAAVLHKIEELAFSVTHGYGLPETGGPVVTCAWKSEWDRLSSEERAKLKARQGVRGFGLTELDVKDPGSMGSVASDGVQMGEVMMRGPSVLKGYLKDERSTAKAMEGGWFHTGDLAVIHPDGYLEIKDRSKDVIISGGENISSVAVGSVLYCHPMVVEAAVVARPDPFWGESPCAFVSTKGGPSNPNVSRVTVTEADMISFCRERLPHFMVPKTVLFIESLPKTFTGKIEKFCQKEHYLEQEQYFHVLLGTVFSC
eukprot:PITA_03910